MRTAKNLGICLGAMALVVVALTAAGTQPSRADDPRWHGGDMRRFGDRDEHVWRGGRWFHGDHEGRGGWWWIVGGAWYFYPEPVYPYPDPYVPPVALPAPPPPGPAPSYWYYCPNPAGYYPYVPTCPTNWMQVPASPG